MCLLGAGKYYFYFDMLSQCCILFWGLCTNSLKIYIFHFMRMPNELLR